MPGERIAHIVDDDPEIRRSLARLLNAAGFEVVVYDSPTAFLDAAATAAGCVLLDLRMPEMDGLELLNQLNASGIVLPVIILTALDDTQSVVRAMKAGALDFIEKPFDDEVLLAAVEAAVNSAKPFSSQEIVEAARRIAQLSPRERQVLEALVAGKPNKVIAYELGLSVRTIELHRARMMERLAVHQFAEAVRIAVLARLSPEGVTSRNQND